MNFLSVNFVSGKKRGGGWCFADEDRGHLGFSDTDLPNVSCEGDAVPLLPPPQPGRFRGRVSCGACKSCQLHFGCAVG